MNTPLSPSYDELVTLVTQLRAVLGEQADALRLANVRIADLEAEIARLKGGGAQGKVGASAPPDWVKPNKPEVYGPPAPRKKRGQGFSHSRLQPTQEVFVTCATCPDCGRELSGGWERWRRQVIDLPAVSPTITDYIVQARHCGVCHKTVVPPSDLRDVVVGQQTFGVGVVSLVAYLDTVGRLPVRTIARLLSCLLHLRVSVGQVVGMLHTVARQGQGAYAALQSALRQSRCVHADETGWRENGYNGYVGSFCTADVRYFTYAKSRAHGVAEAVLGSHYRGVLVSDFYGGYNYHLGLHQRCWAHLLRDVHTLTEKHPVAGGREWAASLYALYTQARAFTSNDAQARARERVRMQQQTTALATPYATACLPQSTLCKRLLQFEAELYTFVEYPFVPCENNAAERSVRPCVITRKISGGTRSAAGSQMMAVLASLFGTWQARGENALVACRHVLIESQKTPLAQTA